MNIIHDLPATNNAMEGWHNSFSADFGSINRSNAYTVRKLTREEQNNRRK